MTEHEFNESILPLAQHIYDFAANLTGNRTDAADITQDVLFKLWNSRNELSKIKNLRAWALKITRNLYYDTVKNTNLSTMKHKCFCTNKALPI